MDREVFFLSMALSDRRLNLGGREVIIVYDLVDHGVVIVLDRIAEEG